MASDIHSFSSLAVVISNATQEREASLQGTQQLVVLYQRMELASLTRILKGGRAGYCARSPFCLVFSKILPLNHPPRFVSVTWCTYRRFVLADTPTYCAHVIVANLLCSLGWQFSPWSGSSILYLGNQWPILEWPWWKWPLWATIAIHLELSSLDSGLFKLLFCPSYCSQLCSVCNVMRLPENIIVQSTYNQQKL